MPTPDDYRSFELEASAVTSVARGNTTVGRFLKFGIPLGAVLVAGWMIYNSTKPRPTSMTTPDKEEFTTTQFPAPSLSTPRPQTDQGTIVIPEAPEVPPAPPVPRDDPAAGASRTTVGGRPAQ
ncbi:hypothetical protein [Labrys sp. 22185]|uniref:hypothetical protein n=1 Tax=Labrys sp. 22185 TaxID=3453888 RepID=UPI003F87845B